MITGICGLAIKSIDLNMVDNNQSNLNHITIRKALDIILWFDIIMTKSEANNKAKRHIKIPRLA